MAQKKGGGSTRNGRDSESKRLGVKVYGGQAINAGGIINVALEYLDGADRATVDAKISGIPDRLNAVWDESAATGDNPAKVADRMAQKLIGRG